LVQLEWVAEAVAAEHLGRRRHDVKRQQVLLPPLTQLHFLFEHYFVFVSFCDFKGLWLPLLKKLRRHRRDVFTG
jgi:hypothetical protein